MLMLKKVWIWLKSYWYVPGLIVVLLWAYILSRRGSAAKELINNINSSYKKQIEVLKKTAAEEKEKKETLKKQYDEIISILEEKYKEEKRKLDNNKKKEIKALLEEHEENPEGLAKLLRKEFNIENE